MTEAGGSRGSGVGPRGDGVDHQWGSSDEGSGASDGAGCEAECSRRHTSLDRLGTGRGVAEEDGSTGESYASQKGPQMKMSSQHAPGGIRHGSPHGTVPEPATSHSCIGQVGGRGGEDGGTPSHCCIVNPPGPSRAEQICGMARWRKQRPAHEADSKSTR